MKLPPALLVAGTDAHRRRVFVRDFTAKCIAAGYATQPVDGADRGALQSIMGTVGVLFPNPTLVVVTRPEKAHPDDVAEHLREPNPLLTLLLISEEDKPAGGVLDGFPPAQTKTFPLPPFYKLDEYAADYARECAKARGVDLPDALARAMVKRVGNDLGVVSYEVDKAAHLARAMGVPVIEPAHLKGTIAPLTELDGTTVVDAIGTKDLTAMTDELYRYKSSKKGDPTVELCGLVLTPAVFRWLQAATLHARGWSLSAASGRVGMSPWYWEKKVIPPSMKWGIHGCRRLLSSISKAQSSVFDGHIRPWVVLESGIIMAARDI
jgi:DNA polymerase III delta subunit